MDSASGTTQLLPVKKQEDDDKNQKQDVKPAAKTLNRVPRLYSFNIFPVTYLSLTQLVHLQL